MKIVTVNGFKIGGDRTYIIADIGSNHKQDLTLAKESIDAAAESGANAIKFQSIQLKELYLYPDAKTTAFIKRLEFPEDWHGLLKEYCDKRGIIFFSSPTYLRAVDLLEEVNVPIYKLASAQIGTFPQIVEKVAALNKPTLFSTGIAAYDEIIKAVNIFKRHINDKFIILHCNSIYPTPPEKVNLRLIQTYKYMFDHPVGFSDHTNGTHIACAAVCLGANVIEKHFTLDRNLDTPDSNSFASDPPELKKLVTEIRAIEVAKNSSDDRLTIQPEEQEFKDGITYRIVAQKQIEKDELITVDHIRYLRNKDGINCKQLELVIGKKASKDIKKDELILYNDVT
ncbi:N-acetylneuraminate synthase family protein [Chryseolinea sp. H1M3-3]|uniref:N-acetylneuraminate synthase family protein n=1 Tax=Chryseolinea sp. H1M3-3 TaxID=3034144 RepID=UPI0023ECBCAE|nr:N-acetylneuraminate synthase family protein [Chryseolinea sp. H1M3-3]